MEKYHDRTFTKTDVMNPKVFNIKDFKPYLVGLLIPRIKEHPSLAMVKNGLTILTENDNLNMKLFINEFNGNTSLEFYDTVLNSNYKVTDESSHYTQKFCVAVDNKQKYCFHDFDVIRMYFDNKKFVGSLQWMKKGLLYR
jgi:hypothetical protein